jgi:exopolysaccharide production protein ExoZ
MQPTEEKRLVAHPVSLDGVQVLRAIAALLVVLHHTFEESSAAIAPRSPDWLTTFGAAGVDIFFVISGFIMFYVSFPANQPTASPASFLLKRIIRIYPFYWFCMAMTIGLWSIGLFHSLQLDADILIRSIFLLPSGHLIVGVGWTLVYEMYFYLIFATTLKFCSPLVSLFATSVTILVLYALGRFAPDATLRDFLGNAIAIEFCFGLILAYLFRRWARLASAARLLWIPGFALLVIAPLIVSHANTNGLPSPARVLAWGIPAFLIVLSFLSLKPNRTPLQRLMILLGDASYAIYLTHPLVMITYARLLKSRFANLPQWPVIPIVVVLSASFGLFIHIFIERRLMASARGLFGRRLVLHPFPKEQPRPADAAKDASC